MNCFPIPCVPVMILFTCVMLTGCGSGGDAHETGSLSGVVTVRNAPVSGCDINFFAADTGTGMMATLKDDGSYKIRDQVWTGTYVVYFTPPLPEAVEHSGPGVKASSQDFQKLVPKPYRTESTTPLTAEVKPGRNTFNFERQQ